MVSGRIAVVLPWREQLTIARSGAVALCALDFARESRFRAGIEILGAAACDVPDAPYRRIASWRRWWRRDRVAYAAAVAEIADDYALLEIQNRPYNLRALRRRSPAAKLVLHLHNDPQGIDGARSVPQRTALLSDCDAVWCVSGFVRDRFLAGLTDSEGKVAVVLNGIAPPRPIGPKAPIVAFTGRINQDKGAVELARAFLAANLPGWRLVFAGADPDRRLAPFLSDRVQSLGHVPHAQALELLASAEVAAVPSLWEEPFGRAAMEALACGCALVTTRRGGLPEVAGDAAVYVDPADLPAFATALRQLAEDALARRELQARARTRVAATFGIRIATARLDAERTRLIGPPVL